MRNEPSVRNLVVGLLFVAAPFAAAYFWTRSNPNSELLLVGAVFCVALAIAFALASGLQQVGGIAFKLSGRSSRDIIILGLTVLSLLTPWTIEVAVGHLPRIFGWTNPLAWLVALGLLMSVMQSARRYHGAALLVAGMALLAWVGWAAWLLTTPDFTRLHFSFTPVDLISTGWYAGLIGELAAVDGLAARWAHDAPPATSNDVLLLSLVPGMGLLRLGSFGRGRIWLGSAVLAIAFIGVSAVNDSEFAFWAHYNTTPPDRGRLDVGLFAVALALIFLVSWVDTWRSLQRREAMSDWLAGVRSRSRADSR